MYFSDCSATPLSVTPAFLASITFGGLAVHEKQVVAVAGGKRELAHGHAQGGIAVEMLAILHDPSGIAQSRSIFSRAFCSGADKSAPSGGDLAQQAAAMPGHSEMRHPGATICWCARHEMAGPP